MLNIIEKILSEYEKTKMINKRNILKKNDKVLKDKKREARKKKS